MKQDKNKEIDLLLRALARRERSESRMDIGKMPARDGAVLSNHLDADELNSFAEGVMPALARARHTKHLADCESCRGFVISLTQASGAPARSEYFEQKIQAGFWQKITSFFSPPVLRYAVPVLALTAVIGISFFALRQQRRPDLVAQNEPTNSASSAYPKEQQTTSPVAQSTIEVPAKIRGDAQPRAGLDSSGYKTGSEDRNSLAQTAPATTEADAPPGSSLKDSRQSKQADGAAGSRPFYAPEPQAAPPPAKPALNESDKIAGIRKEEVARREVQALPVEEEKNQPRNQQGRHGPSRSNATLNRNTQVDGLMTERGETRAKSKKDSDDETETRTVSGKRFRHQGNAWIDTAYDSSRRTTTVSRGSEQFRALIADEPGIRVIAEKLNGVVIVVWNGRAYRIQ